MRLLWRQNVADPFIDRFTRLLDAAVDSGEIGPVHTGFSAQMLRQWAFVTRDEAVLGGLGMTAEAALLEIDSIVWEGIRVT